MLLSDTEVDRSSVLEHKATFGGRNGFPSFAAKSPLLVADDLFDFGTLKPEAALAGQLVEQLRSSEASGSLRRRCYR
jgi:hypothetical protein